MAERSIQSNGGFNVGGGRDVCPNCGMRAALRHSPRSAAGVCGCLGAALFAEWSKDWRYQRSCAGKRRFSGRAEAEREAKSYNRERLPLTDMQAYKCGFCLRWHIGHDNRRFYENKRRRLYADFYHIIAALPAA